MQSNQGAPFRRNALVALFVLSGVGGLSLEVVWTRQLATSLGSTSRATTAVVAMFMAGLALGNALGARRARGLATPVRAYGLAEVGIALGAAVCTLLLPRLEGLSSAAWRYTGAAALMLAPTVCMGFTWPLLTESWRRVEARAAGRLYAANTLGAAAGALLTGFVSIGLVGVAKTGYASAILDLLCGALALAIGDGDTPTETAAVDAREGDPTPRWFLAVAAASGFLALAEEIVWTRALLPYVNSSTYAFAAILGLYLLGLAGGSWLASRDARADTHGGSLARVQLGLALSVAATPRLFALAEQCLPLYSGVRRAVTLATWAESMLATFVKTGLALSVPTVLLGVNTVLALRVATSFGMRPARAAGAWGSANTVGAIAGTVLAGFVLLPVLGAHRAISLCAVGHLALALGWRARAPSASPAAAPALVAALAVAGLVAVTPAAPFTGRLTAGLRLLLVDEGPQDTTAVVQTGNVRGVGTFRAILSNGVAYASDNAPSRRYMGLLGHLPALLADDPSRALVICVGTGTTAHAVAVHPEVRALTLVDISPVVHRTLPLFAHVNGAIWKDRRVRIVEADGRQYLSQHDGSFGLITLEPPPPRMAGAASLYTRELYARARRSLGPGGVIAQWLPLHGMTADETWMLARTFLEEFPDGALFVLTPDEAALVGGASPFRPDVDRVRARLADPAVADALHAIGLQGATPEALTLELLALSPTHGAALRALSGRGMLITDDRPMIEQFAIGLARSNSGAILSTDGRASLFDALGRTTPLALSLRGAVPNDLPRALLDAQARYRAIR